MKQYIAHLALSLFACAALTACVDDDYMETDKGHTGKQSPQDGWQGGDLHGGFLLFL